MGALQAKEESKLQLFLQLVVASMLFFYKFLTFYSGGVLVVEATKSELLMLLDFDVRGGSMFLFVLFKHFAKREENLDAREIRAREGLEAREQRADLVCSRRLRLIFRWSHCSQ